MDALHNWKKMGNWCLILLSIYIIKRPSMPTTNYCISMFLKSQNTCLVLYSLWAIQFGSRQPSIETLPISANHFHLCLSLRNTFEMGVYQLSDFYVLAKKVDHDIFHGIFISVAFGMVMLLWRFWTFTIRPLLYPNEPKEVPYWIPCEQSINPLASSVLKWGLVRSHR